MKQSHVIRNYYVLPCCLLLLNLCVEMVSYKARMFGDPMLRTAAIMGMVLFGGSAVGFVVAPAITKLVGGLHRQSRQGAGELGGVLFLVLSSNNNFGGGCLFCFGNCAAFSVERVVCIVDGYYYPPVLICIYSFFK